MNIGRIVSAAPRRVIGVLLLATVLLTACGGGSGESWAGVTVNSDADTIYVAYGNKVAAVDPASGTRLWSYEYEGAQFFAVPTIVDDTIYVGDYDGRLHAINTSGERQWLYEPDRHTLFGPVSLEPKDRVIGAVAVGEDYVYFGLGSRNVVAVSRSTAEEAWTFETDHGVWATPLYLPADSERGRDTDTVYIASLDKYIYALDAASGDMIWKEDLGGAAPGNMVYDEARNWVYVGTFISELVAVDLGTHEIVHRFEAGDWLWGAPVMQDDMLYFGDLSGKLYAVRITDNGFEEVWSMVLAEGAIRSTPLLTNGIIIVGSKDKNVYAVNKADGSNRWYKETDGEALTNLVFLADTALTDDTVASLVVVGTNDSDNLLVAYNTENGERSWRYKH